MYRSTDGGWKGHSDYCEKLYPASICIWKSQRGVKKRCLQIQMLMHSRTRNALPSFKNIPTSNPPSKWRLYSSEEVDNKPELLQHWEGQDSVALHALHWDIEQVSKISFIFAWDQNSLKKIKTLVCNKYVCFSCLISPSLEDKLIFCK